MTLTTIIICSCLSLAPGHTGQDSLLVLFWNLENFFDWKRDSTLGNPSEASFTPQGQRHWTRTKFMRKCDAVSKAVFWIAGQEGRLPDVIGLAEIENAFVLRRLLEWTALKKAGYHPVHFDSPDPRGIDVALLYRGKVLQLVNAKPVPVEDKRNKQNFRTRDILLAEFMFGKDERIAFLVNHHPSKYGGNSSGKRKTALETLSSVTDSLFNAGFERIVAMGDFNDTPPSTEGYSRKMVNLAAPLAKKGEGSIKFQGRWEMIDMFFVSESIVKRNVSVKMTVAKVPFLMVRDNAYAGEKPFRTFTGPRYSGGVSDHCPIVLMIQ